jgi:hypothetical protein
MAASMNVKDLPPKLWKQLGIRRPKQHSFTKKTVRTWPLKTLALLAELSQDQRRRVLEHALKVNRL